MDDELLETPATTPGDDPGHGSETSDTDGVLRVGPDVVRWDLEQATEAPGLSEATCLFERAGELIGIPGAVCSGLRTLETLTPLPLAPRGVVGLTHIDDEILPVVDVATIRQSQKRRGTDPSVGGVSGGSDHAKGTERPPALAPLPSSVLLPSSALLVAVEGPSVAGQASPTSPGETDPWKAIVIFDRLLGFEVLDSEATARGGASAGRDPWQDSDEAEKDWTLAVVELPSIPELDGSAGSPVTILDMAGILGSMHRAAGGGS